MRNENTLPDRYLSVQPFQNQDRLFLELQTSLSCKVGQEFFDAAVAQLNKLVRADFTLIGALKNNHAEVRTISVCDQHTILKNLVYALKGTPCEEVTKGRSLIINDGVTKHYPDDLLLQEMQVEGYVGISIFDSYQKPMGIVVSLFKRKVENPDFVRFAFELMSLRIKAEMERLDMEQMLRHQQERYEFALKVEDFGVFDWNIYTGEMVFSPRLFQIIEHSPQEFHPTYANWLSLVHPEDYEKLAVSIPRKIVNDKEYYGPVRYRIRTRHGKYKWIQIQSYSFIYDEELRAKRNIGVVKEIEELVQTEDQLRSALEREVILNNQIKQREEWYAFALKVGKLGVYDWYVQEDRAVASPRLYEIMGYEPHEIKMGHATWLSLVHPEDHCKVNWDRYKQKAASNPNTSSIYRLRHKSGVYRWVEAQNMVIEWNECGDISRMIGVIKDIDNEKCSADLLHEAYEKQKELNEALIRREEALTESQAKLISQMTILQRLNRELQESDNRWQDALESNGDGVCEWNIQTNQCYFSERAKEIIGLPLRDVNDYRKIITHIHPHSQSEFITNLRLCLKPPYDRFVMEVQLLNDKGNYRWIMFRGKVVEWNELNKPLKMLGTVTDLSPHKVIQKELTVYEEMIKQNQSAILFLSMDGAIEFANNTAADLLGYRQHEIIGQDIRILVAGKSAMHLMCENFRGQQIFLAKSKRKITTQVATSLIRQDGDLIGFVLNIMDITEKKRLQDEVTILTMAKLEAELEAQRKQTEMIIHVQENEKESIARELHDGVGQLLSLAKLQLEQLESVLPHDDLRQQCHHVFELMQHITTDIKGLTSDLMPLSIRKLGLESAVSSLLERYHAIKGKEVAITCKIHLEGYEPDQHTAMHIYRIAQEAINNSMKYSNASSVSFMLMKLKNSINLIVEDNGSGFDLDFQLNKKNSFGLKTMMERATLVHGKLMINSACHAGTTISLTIPLNPHR